MSSLVNDAQAFLELYFPHWSNYHNNHNYSEILTPYHLLPTFDLNIYWKEKKKRRVSFIPKFHSNLKKFVKYFTMITKRYMYGTKVPNFIGLWSISLELLKFIGSYPPNLEIKSNWKSISGVPPSCCRCCPNCPLDRVNQSIDSSHRDVIPFIDQRIP